MEMPDRQAVLSLRTERYCDTERGYYHGGVMTGQHDTDHKVAIHLPRHAVSQLQAPVRDGWSFRQPIMTARSRIID